MPTQGRRQGGFDAGEYQLGDGMAYGGEPPRGRAGWQVGAIAVLSVLAAVPPVALAVSVVAGSPPAESAQASGPDARSVAAAPGSAPPAGGPPARQAAQWLQEHLDPSAYVVTDEGLADELSAQGFPAQRLRRYTTGDTASHELVTSGDPGPARGVVVATPALLSAVSTDPGAGRALQALPLLARFGAEGQAVQVFQVAQRDTDQGDPAGDAATRADQTQRRQAGRQLAGNPRLRLTGTAAQALAQGDVDARLLALLAQLTAGHILDVDALPVPPGEEGLGGPRRIAILRAVDGVPVTGDDGPAARVAAQARAQSAPYTPSVQLRQRPVGGPVLEIAYDLPSPVGLLQSRSFTTS